MTDPRKHRIVLGMDILDKGDATMRSIISKAVLLSLTVLSALTACGKSPKESASAAPEGASSGLKTAFASGRSVIKVEKHYDQIAPIAGPSAALSEFVSVSDPDISATKVTDYWLTFVIIDAMGIDGKMSDLSKAKFIPGYAGEPDAFKKREILQSGLPLVNKAIDYYRGRQLFKLSYHGPDLRPYDFSTSSFGLPCDSNFYDQPVGQNISSELTAFPIKSVCSIEVKNSDQARKIERLRADGRIETNVTDYIRIDGVDSSNGRAFATVLHRSVDLIDDGTWRDPKKQLIAHFEVGE